MSRVGCIIPAAGRGERLGAASPKALRHLGGITLLEHSIRAITAARSVVALSIAAPIDQLDVVRSIANDMDVAASITVVPGGQNRADSVRSGAAALPDDLDVVLVHDAARPLVPLEVVDSVISACSGGAPAVVPALPVADTIKRIDADGRVRATVPRADLRAAQTPQGFAPATLRRALAASGPAATDDASMVEQLGEPVLVVPGHEEAFKVTRPLDLALAQLVLRRRSGGGV